VKLVADLRDLFGAPIDKNQATPPKEFKLGKQQLIPPTPDKAE
jgi:hypothetical protein